MRVLLILMPLFLLTACLDLAVQSVQRASKEVGGVEGVVDVAFDNLVKADLASKWAYAANGGDAEAQYNMGKAFCCGKRPFYNTYDALRWFCKSAKQGQRDAMLEIGKIYENAHQEEGSVIPRDDILAYVYYKKAVEHGNDNAIRYKDEKFAELKIKERDSAKKILNQWPDIQCEVN